METIPRLFNPHNAEAEGMFFFALVGVPSDIDFNKIEMLESKAKVRSVLSDYSIEHSTIEIELPKETE